MTKEPNALDLLDAWWSVPEAKRAEALAKLSSMLKADQAQPEAAALDPEAKLT